MDSIRVEEEREELLSFEFKEIKKPNYKKLLKHLILTFVSLFMIFPFAWMLLGALKTNYEIWNEPFKILPSNPQWSNFLEVFKVSSFESYFINSFSTSLIITLIILINSALFAYAIAFFNFRGKNLLFTFVMGIYMLPSAVTYVPSYIILARLNMLDSLSGLVISNLASIFGVFLLRQAFLKLDKGIIEAAKIDGASDLSILWKIIFPICKPSFVSLALISFISNYNSYLWPSLIINSPEKQLVSMGLRQFFIQEGAYGMNWPLIMAASSLVVIPLLVIFGFMQNYFMNGINDTGNKE